MFNLKKASLIALTSITLGSTVFATAADARPLYKGEVRQDIISNRYYGRGPKKPIVRRRRRGPVIKKHRYHNGYYKRPNKRVVRKKIHNRARYLHD